MEPLLKENQSILLSIKRLGINGEGIGYYKKQAVFVPGAIPPEEVIVKITEVSRNFSRGELLKINTRAKNRAHPFCRHYVTCGGCQTQHIKYDEQLALKQEMLSQTIDRYSGLDITKIKFNDMIGMSDNKHYRYKSQMPVQNTKNGLTTGFYKPNSNELVPIVHCPVHTVNINSVNEKILAICDTHQLFAFDPHKMRGLLRYIVIRESHLNGEIQVTLVVTIFNHALHLAAKDILEISNVVSVGISKNRDAKNVEVFGEEVEILAGKNTIAEGINDIKYDLKPKAFYQLNPAQAIKLYSAVKSHLNFDKDKVIVDAYCGAGAISMYLAPFAQKIVGIDISTESIYSALHNRKINKFENLSFEQGEIKTVLPKLFESGLNPDVIIIDPPRSGIDDRTLDILIRKAVKKIIYVSCNPSTLAKNLKVLSKVYKVTSITPLDMFPHTSHIESITILEKK